MPAIFVSPFAKLMAVLLLVSALAGGVKLWFVEHDAAVVAEVAAAEAAANLVIMKADAARVNDALNARAIAAEAQAINSRQVREAVSNAPRSTSCVQSVPLRAAIDGLRSKPGSR